LRRQVLRQIQNKPIHQLRIDFLRRQRSKAEEVLLIRLFRQPPFQFAPLEGLAHLGGYLPGKKPYQGQTCRCAGGQLGQRFRGDTGQPLVLEERFLLDALVEPQPAIGQIEARALDRGQLSPQLRQRPRIVGVVRSAAGLRIEVEQGRREIRETIRAETAQQPGLAGAADAVEHDDRQRLPRRESELTTQDTPFMVPVGEVAQFLTG
jgi:hypothetical protein